MTTRLAIHWQYQIEALMYRIIKRIVRTITTVTWSIHWEEDYPGRQAREEKDIVQTSYAVEQEEVLAKIKLPVEVDQKSDTIQN